MEDLTTVRVTAADRTDGSVIITFSDGRCGLYSAALLYTTLSQARELHEAPDVLQEEPEHA